MSNLRLLQTDLVHSVIGYGSFRRSYSLYGHAPRHPSLSLGFNAEHPEPWLEGYNLGSYRTFNSILMRFNSPDSWSPFERLLLNCYAYGLGDPINNCDPSGHAPPKAVLLKKVIADSRTLASEKLGYTPDKADVKQALNLGPLNLPPAQQIVKNNTLTLESDLDRSNRYFAKLDRDIHQAQIDIERISGPSLSREAQKGSNATLMSAETHLHALTQLKNLSTIRNVLPLAYFDSYYALRQ